MSSTPIWLITGASAGLGLALARHVLSRGHRVIGTTRNPAKAREVIAEIEAKGGKWVTLDTGSSDHDIATVVRNAETIFGRIDVVVNNAAYCVLGSTEDVSSSQVEEQMRVNFLGPLSVIRALLPGMRERGSGTILNISSIQGFAPAAANGIYAASKAALEAATDALREEVSSFGINVFLIIPGAFRTQFANAGVLVDSSVAYLDNDHPVGRRLAWIKRLGGGAANGDPFKAAKIMFEVATGEGVGQPVREQRLLRVFIGSDGWKVANNKATDIRRTIDSSQNIASATDF